MRISKGGMAGDIHVSLSHASPLMCECRHRRIMCLGERQRVKRRGVVGRLSLFRRNGAIQRCPLLRRAIRRGDQTIHILRRHLLPVFGASGAGNALVHQCATEIVSSGQAVATPLHRALPTRPGCWSRADAVRALTACIRMFRAMSDLCGLDRDSRPAPRCERTARARTR